MFDYTVFTPSSLANFILKHFFSKEIVFAASSAFALCKFAIGGNVKCRISRIIYVGLSLDVDDWIADFTFISSSQLVISCHPK